MADQPMITRTYRAAIRVGEDFITIEETISLPPGASAAEINEAVDTGLRMYHAQQAAIESQMQAIREQHPGGPIRILDPDAPASEKQRSYLEHLINTLALSDEHMQRVLREHNTTYNTLTKGAASEIIDVLKQQLDVRPPAEAAVAQADDEPATLPLREHTATPASSRQLAALQRVAAQQGADLLAEARSRFGAGSLDELSSAEAGVLLQHLQGRR